MGMGAETWLSLTLGTLAGLCSTTSFVPQVIKIVREGDTAAISKRKVAYIDGDLYEGPEALDALAELKSRDELIGDVLAGIASSAAIAIGSLPIIAFNAVSFLLSGTVLVFKLRNQRRHRRRRAEAGQPCRDPG